LKLDLIEEFELTRAGQIALSLSSEGLLGIFAGFISGLGLLKDIKSRYDLLFIASHFIKKWRVDIEGPKLDSMNMVSQDLREKMNKALFDFKSICSESDLNFDEISNTEEITALYFMFPDKSGFETSVSQLDSYVVHFLKKLEAFNYVAKEPYCYELIKEMNEYYDF